MKMVLTFEKHDASIFYGGFENWMTLCKNVKNEENEKYFTMHSADAKCRCRGEKGETGNEKMKNVEIENDEKQPKTKRVIQK